MAKKKEVIKAAYKGFNQDMTCRNDFKYEEGKEYECDKAECCTTGFHSCTYPLDVFGYYAPSDGVDNLRKYHKVEVSGDIDENDEDSKIASTKIKIGAKLNFKDIIDASIEFILERVKKENKADDDYSLVENSGEHTAASNTGNRSAASNTGNRSAASNTGDCSAASNTGDCSAASNTGNRSAASNTGYCSAASNTGNRSAASNTGYCSAASNTGDCSAASNTGNRSAASNTGNRSAASNTGNRSAASNTGYCSAASNVGYEGAAFAASPESIAISIGFKGRAKGVKGSHFVLADWGDDYDDFRYKKVSMNPQMFLVDGEKVKENTWYTLINGKLVECDEDNDYYDRKSAIPEEEKSSENEEEN